MSLHELTHTGSTLPTHLPASTAHALLASQCASQARLNECERALAAAKEEQQAYQRAVAALQREVAEKLEELHNSRSHQAATERSAKEAQAGLEALRAEHAAAQRATQGLAEELAAERERGAEAARQLGAQVAAAEARAASLEAQLAQAQEALAVERERGAGEARAWDRRLQALQVGEECAVVGRSRWWRGAEQRVHCQDKTMFDAAAAAAVAVTAATCGIPLDLEAWQPHCFPATPGRLPHPCLPAASTCPTAQEDWSGRLAAAESGWAAKHEKQRQEAEAALEESKREWTRKYYLTEGEWFKKLQAANQDWGACVHRGQGRRMRGPASAWRAEGNTRAHGVWRLLPLHGGASELSALPGSHPLPPAPAALHPAHV